MLASPIALKDYLFADSEAEYQLAHYAPTDIPRRELAAPAGARYLRKPDDDESRPHGAVGPRAFVMPLMDADQMNLGPRFSARTRFKLPRMARAPRHRHPRSPLSHSLLIKPADPEAEYQLEHDVPTDISLFISGSSEYQLNQNGSVDISRRELSAPAGAQYLCRSGDGSLNVRTNHRERFHTKTGPVEHPPAFPRRSSAQTGNGGTPSGDLSAGLEDTPPLFR